MPKTGTGARFEDPVNRKILPGDSRKVNCPEGAREATLGCGRFGWETGDASVLGAKKDPANVDYSTNARSYFFSIFLVQSFSVHAKKFCPLGENWG